MWFPSFFETLHKSTSWRFQEFLMMGNLFIHLLKNISHNLSQFFPSLQNYGTNIFSLKCHSSHWVWMKCQNFFCQDQLSFWPSSYWTMLTCSNIFVALAHDQTISSHFPLACPWYTMKPAL